MMNIQNIGAGCPGKTEHRSFATQFFIAD